MTTYHRAILPAPNAAVTDGRCNFGTFDRAINHLNLLDARNPLGWLPGRWLKNFRLKEWQAIQLHCQDWFFCLAVYNTKTLGTAIIMAYDKNARQMHVYQHKAPCWKLKVPSGLANSHCYYHSRDFAIDIYNRLGAQQVDTVFSARNFPGLPNLQGEFSGYHHTQPQVIIQPLGNNRPLYSHKALMPSVGRLTVNHQQTHYTRQHTAMIMDDHKGYYPYIMRYDWVTALGFDSRGVLLGFNLTDNQVRDHQRYNENCLWHDGQMYPLPPITIHRPDGVNGVWHISDRHGQVNLYFTPLADVPLYLNWGIAQTRYHGPTGEFRGGIMAADNRRIRFDGLIGMGEQKYIRM